GGKIVDAYDHYVQAKALLTDATLAAQAEKYIKELEPKALPLKQQQAAADTQRQQVEAKLRQLGEARAAAEKQAAATPVQALDMIQAGQAAQALPMLRSAVAAAPSLSEGHYLLAEALLQTGDAAGALPQYRAAAAQSNDPALRQDATLKADGIEAGVGRSGAV